MTQVPVPELVASWVVSISSDLEVEESEQVNFW